MRHREERPTQESVDQVIAESDADADETALDPEQSAEPKKMPTALFVAHVVGEMIASLPCR